MGKIMSVFSDGSTTPLYNIKEVNRSFATASLDIMYTGENRNGSNISRASVEAALPTLYNVPIVANWDPEAREIGGHDIEITSDGDGGLKVRNLTVPCGVITDHTKFSFNTKADENGVEHEYLTADGVVLWKRQDVYEYIVNDCGGVIPHSMEIDVDAGEMNEETSYFDVNAFQFTALCLLGTATPCFEGSKLQVYADSAKDQMKAEFAEMMSELKELYSLDATVSTVADNKISTEGGELMTEEKRMLIEEFGIDVDTLDFSVEDLTVEELRAKFEEMTSASNESSEDASTAEDNSGDAEASSEDAGETSSTEDNDEQNGEGTTFELDSNLYTQIRLALASETVVRPSGWECQLYWMADYDAEKSMVYFESSEDGYLYGAPFTMDGDTVKIDFDAKSRKKYAIVDFEEGSADTQTVAFSMIAKADEQIATVVADRDGAAQKLSEGIEKFEAMQTELAELRNFKHETEVSAATEKAQAVFAQFADLDGNESFEALKTSVSEDCMKYDVDTLEEKCFAIRGRMSTKATFSAAKAPKFSIEKSESEDVAKPYGGIVEEYRGK